MSRPLKIRKIAVDAQSSVNCGESASDIMNLTAAAALLTCRSALIEGRAAARAALIKHQALITRGLAQALEEVGSYPTNEVTFTVNPPSPPLETPRFVQCMAPRAYLTWFCCRQNANMNSCRKCLFFVCVNAQVERNPLHEAVVNGDAATVEALIVSAGPKLIDVKDSVG